MKNYLDLISAIKPVQFQELIIEEWFYKNRLVVLDNNGKEKLIKETLFINTKADDEGFITTTEKRSRVREIENFNKMFIEDLFKRGLEIFQDKQLSIYQIEKLLFPFEYEITNEQSETKTYPSKKQEFFEGKDYETVSCKLNLLIKIYNDKEPMDIANDTRAEQALPYNDELYVDALSNTTHPKEYLDD